MGVDVARCDRLDAEVLREVPQEDCSPRVSALERTLELDVEALAAERASKPRRCVRVEQPEPPPRAARKADETLGLLHDRLERHGGRQRLAVLSPRAARPRVGGGQQPAEVGVPAPRLHEQCDVRAAVERHLGAGDRPHAEGLRRLCELERPVDAVVVGERERLVAELRRRRRDLFWL
jgi:hypothetical protein